MKKVVLFTAVLMLAGAVSLSAAEPKFEPAISLTGEASFTFGINLLAGSEATGIANASSSDLTLTLIAADSNEKGGKEGEEVYGWIKLKTFKVELENDAGTSSTTIDGSADGIEAKLFLGPVYVNILGLGDDDNISKADDITQYVTTGAVTLTTAQSAEYNGIAIGLKDTSVVAVVVGVSSLADWTGAADDSTTSYAYIGTVTSTGEDVPAGERYVSVDGTEILEAGTASTAATIYNVYSVTTTTVAGNAANTDNVYNFYAGIDLNAIPGLILSAAVNLSTGADTPIGFGVKAGYDIAIAEGIKLTPSVGFDFQTGDPDALKQVTGKLVLDLPGDDHNDWDVFGDGDADFPTQVAVTVSTDLAEESQLDLSFYAFDGTLIPVLDLLAVVELPNLGADFAQTGVGIWASADLGAAVPWGKVILATIQGASELAGLQIAVGVDIKVITNTTFSVEYDTTSVFGIKQENVLKFTTKIAY